MKNLESKNKLQRDYNELMANAPIFVTFRRRSNLVKCSVFQATATEREKTFFSKSITLPRKWCSFAAKKMKENPPMNKVAREVEDNALLTTA